MAEHNELGKKGEQKALEFLQSMGYSILETNWRYQKAEIDILAQSKDELIVVEVKTRTNAVHESPEEAVTRSKQKRIIKAADAFIQEKHLDCACRFDIITVLFQQGEEEINHIQDAFSATL